MPTARVTSQGRITIPYEIRQTLGLRAGDKLRFMIDETGACHVFPITRDVRELKGMVDVPSRPVNVDAMNSSIHSSDRRTLSRAALRFIGSDKSPGDTARNTKRLLRRAAKRA